MIEIFSSWQGTHQPPEGFIQRREGHLRAPGSSEQTTPTQLRALQISPDLPMCAQMSQGKLT